MPILPSLGEDATPVAVFTIYSGTARPLVDYRQVLLCGPSPLSIAERELVGA